jgi:hypothetical protein
VQVDPGIQLNISLTTSRPFACGSHSASLTVIEKLKLLIAAAPGRQTVPWSWSPEFFGTDFKKRRKADDQTVWSPTLPGSRAAGREKPGADIADNPQDCLTRPRIERRLERLQRIWVLPLPVAPSNKANRAICHFSTLHARGPGKRGALNHSSPCHKLGERGAEQQTFEREPADPGSSFSLPQQPLYPARKRACFCML